MPTTCRRSAPRRPPRASRCRSRPRWWSPPNAPARRAVAGAELGGDVAGCVDALNLLALTCTDLGLHDEALTAIEQALAAVVTLDDHELRSGTSNRAGTVHAALGDHAAGGADVTEPQLRTGLERAGRAPALAEASGNPYRVALSHLNAGALLVHLDGTGEAAEDRFAAAARIIAEHGYRSLELGGCCRRWAGCCAGASGTTTC